MDPKEFDAALHDVNTRLDRLKALYEMYFQGIERREPQVARKQLERLMQQLRRNQPRTTHLRFKFQSTLQRYTTLQTYWRRVTRQIEEGTYRRDIQRMKRRQKEREQRKEAREERPVEEGARSGYELSLDDVEDLSSLLDDPGLQAVVEQLGAPAPAPQKPVAPAPAPAAPSSKKAAVFGRPKEKARHRRPVPAPASAQSPRVPPPPRPRLTPDERRMRAIYDDYVSARKQNNERVDNLRYEKVQRSIQKMLPKLQEKHRGKKIDFKVVVKNGRVGLKPVADD